MKSMIRFLFGILAALTFSGAHAGGVAMSGMQITHQTGHPAGDVFIVKFVVVNNSGSTITGAKVFADRLDCDPAKSFQQAAAGDTPSIPSGASHQFTMIVLPGNEANLRMSLRQDRNSPSLAEVTVPRAKYDAKGAALYDCRPIERRVAPTAPSEKMRTIMPR